MKKMLLVGLLIFAAQFSANAQQIIIKNGSNLGVSFNVAPTTAPFNCNSAWNSWNNTYTYMTILPNVSLPPVLLTDYQFNPITFSQVTGLAFQFNTTSVFLPFCGKASGGKRYSISGYDLEVQWLYDNSANQLFIYFEEF